jgi:hypothetical protein
VCVSERERERGMRRDRERERCASNFCRHGTKPMKVYKLPSVDSLANVFWLHSRLVC